MATTREDGTAAAVAAWLRAAVEDAERRGLPELKPLLEGLAASTIQLRRAGWNDEVDGRMSASRLEGRPPATGEAAGKEPQS
jgi:hypothetical protein